MESLQTAVIRSMIVTASLLVSILIIVTKARQPNPIMVLLQLFNQLELVKVLIFSLTNPLSVLNLLIQPSQPSLPITIMLRML
jgi:hypothetical protein